MEQTEPIVEATPAAQAAPDPFAVDEARFASLSPEQRAALDPVLEDIRGKAKAEIEKTRTTFENDYKPYKEKAESLDKLTNWAPFKQFWAHTQQQMAQGQNPQTQQAIAQSKPQDFATPEEWSQAVLEASQGDPSKIQNIQQRMFTTMATPFIQKFTNDQRELNSKLEMKELMEEHDDWKELDKIGLNEKNEGTSLLEHCLMWAQNNGKPLEEGYLMAKRWADSMKSGAQAQAMGMVQGKKDGILAGNSTALSNGSVVVVDSIDEAMKRSMNDQLAGIKGVRYEVKK
jgi:hypothetical protein